MSRPKLLDLFCCEGGASMGYHRAGLHDDARRIAGEAAGGGRA